MASGVRSTPSSVVKSPAPNTAVCTRSGAAREDLLAARQAERRLDEREDADGAGVEAGRLLGLRERGIGDAQRLGVLDLRHHDRVEPAGDDGGDVLLDRAELAAS